MASNRESSPGWRVAPSHENVFICKDDSLVDSGRFHVYKQFEVRPIRGTTLMLKTPQGVF